MDQSGHKDQESNIFQITTIPTHASSFFKTLSYDTKCMHPLQANNHSSIFSSYLSKGKYKAPSRVFIKALTKYLERHPSLL